MVIFWVVGFAILDEVLGVFVDAEVGQMNELILFPLSFVLPSSEPSQPILINVNFKWIKTCDKHINSKIILEIVYQMGVIDILRNQSVFAIVDFC